MKKLLLIAALLFASYGAFADDFDLFVAGMRESGVGMVRTDKSHRIVFLDVKADFESLSDQELAEIKSMILKGMPAENAAIIRELNVTIVFNYISKNGKIYSVVITSSDL